MTSNNKNKTAIGIDLGTTYSCRTTPSYIVFTNTERLVGDAAKNQVARNPTNAVFDTFYWS